MGFQDVRLSLPWELLEESLLFLLDGVEIAASGIVAREESATAGGQHAGRKDGADISQKAEPRTAAKLNLDDTL